MRIRACTSSAAAVRLAAAQAWLATRPAGEEHLILAPSPEAGADLVRQAAVASVGGAALGWRRVTLGRLASDLAGPAMLRRGLAPASRLAAEAVAARTLTDLAARGRLGRFTALAASPGLARAVAATLEEVRLAGIGAAALSEVDPALAEVLAAYEAELARARLVDRAGILALALEAAEAQPPFVQAPSRSPIGLPVLIVDPALDHALAVRLVGALIAAAPEALVTAPAGDGAALAALARLGVDVGAAAVGTARSAEAEAEGAAPPASGSRGGTDPRSAADCLRRLQVRLFEPAADAATEASDGSGAPAGQVVAAAAPGEAAAARNAADARAAEGGEASARGNPRGAWDAHEASGEAQPGRRSAPSMAALALDATVRVLSAPGESRECVEIARALLAHAGAGVPFDRMAVLLRAPESYRPHLEEAFARAGVPVYLARGARSPDPAGRAFLALLDCAAEGLSASGFAAYLALGELPAASQAGTPPEALPAAERLAPPDDDLLAGPLARAVGALGDDADRAALWAPGFRLPASGRTAGVVPAGAESASAPVAGGTLRAPRHWERLLVDAAVVGGGTARWQRRLDGLAAELGLALDEALAAEGEQGPRAERLRRDLGALGALRDFALPLLDDLARLPERATWGEWLERLSALATRALRDPERVLGALGELAPLAPLGPVDLAEVRLVLAARLLEAAQPPPAHRYGRVFVGPIELARGLSFDVVSVPGLAERVFPARVVEDPILLDAARRRLAARAGPGSAGGCQAAAGPRAGSPPGTLAEQPDRLARERLLLRLAVGAAEQALVISYPRIEPGTSRPRVPSFYALDVVRAATGLLPSFDELARAAERAASARLGWPAPRAPAQAIDTLEYDLACLEAALAPGPGPGAGAVAEGATQEGRRDAPDGAPSGAGETTHPGEVADRAASATTAADRAAGATRYLLFESAHLDRSLRARHRREGTTWTRSDGLLAPPPWARAALAARIERAGADSATGLEALAACPYRYFLRAVHRLAPRVEPEPIERLDPLERGALVHDVLRELLRRLEARGLLPVSAGTLGAARALCDEVVAAVALDYADRLAPAIPRVFAGEVARIGGDLAEWLRLAADDASGFVPWRFELGFGLAGRRPRGGYDERSAADPVALEPGLALRGAIDVVERHPGDGRLRVTDHKTGRIRLGEGEVTRGGTTLQPVLYALVAERLFPGQPVTGGRLASCTQAGRFAERSVPLDEEARAAARALAAALTEARGQGAFLAAPGPRECSLCDYQAVCGPHAERRAERKGAPPLADLAALRALP